jgi:hypothetical protein
MKEILMTLQYILPSIVVFFASWLVLKEFFKQENIKKQLQLLDEKQKISLPLRLQAYERMVLLLERISPGNLVMRLHKQGLTVAQFQKTLIQGIRDEFDHNLSQQLYISADAWEMIKRAKEEMIRQINASAAKLPADGPSTDLSRKIMEMSIEKSATRKALDFLKKEADKFM